MTHYEILNAERFGSRCEEYGYSCARCGQPVDEEDAEFDVGGRAFCDKGCRDRFYGIVSEV